MSAILVLTNLTNLEDAKSLAHSLISKKLCACVNIGSKSQSIYCWEGKIEESEEYKVLIKTNTDKYDALQREIKALSKYQVPEIIAIDVKQISPEYLNWLNSVME